MKKKLSVKKITEAGVLLALILIFLLCPISFGGIVDVAVVAIIAVIIACQFDGFFMGLFCGAAFGITSLISSFTTGAGQLLAPAFHNPMISVFPRLLIPVVCFLVFKGMRKLFYVIYSHRKAFNPRAANHLSLAVSSIVSAAAAVLVNTGVVLGMLFAFHAGQTFGSTVIGTALLSAILVTNFPIELGVCCAAAAPILLALKSSFRSGNSDKLAPVCKVPKEPCEDCALSQQ